MSANKTKNPLGGKPITDDCKVYSCRLCRKLLFTSNDLLAHDTTRDAKGKKKFKFQNFNADEQKEVCTSLFLDPDVAVWVAKESRDAEEKRQEEMEKERQLIEDEEIFGPGGRPKTPPLTTALVYGDDVSGIKETSKKEKASSSDTDSCGDDRFGDDFDDEEEGEEEENRKIVLSPEALASLRKQKNEAAHQPPAAAAAAKKSAVVDDDEDSDEEIISSDDEDDKKKKTNNKKSLVPTKKPAVLHQTKPAAPEKKNTKKEDDDDSDEEIIDDDEDDFCDDDDFKSNYGGPGGKGAERRQQFRVTKAAIDIVDPDTIYCPHCRCKIGAQNWNGSQCSCAAWVTPAFKVHAKAVDEIPGSLYLRLYK